MQRVTAQSGVQGCEMTTGVRAEMTTCVTGLPPEMTTGVTGEMTTGDKGLPSEMKIGNMEISYEMTSDMVLPQERTTGDTRLPCQALPEWVASSARSHHGVAGVVEESMAAYLFPSPQKNSNTTSEGEEGAAGDNRALNKGGDRKRYKTCELTKVWARSVKSKWSQLPSTAWPKEHPEKGGMSLSALPLAMK